MPEPPADPIECARALHAQGTALREIAELLDVSARTVARWTDPERAERDRRRSREAKQGRRRACERCSRPLSYDRAGGLCQTCGRADAHERIERVATLYQRGHKPLEIAGTVGISEGYARNILGELARAGRIQPRWTFRDRETVRERDQRILTLRAHGDTHAQIAQAVALAPASVNQALVRLGERDAA